MNQSAEKVDYLKKVLLSVSGGKNAEEAENSEVHKNVSFIFGLGPEGLSPFEMELSGKVLGDEIILNLFDKDRVWFFGHTVIWFMPDTKILDSQVLKVVVEEVRGAPQKEIIRELAEIAEFGHGCSCC